MPGIKRLPLAVVIGAALAGVSCPAGFAASPGPVAGAEKQRVSVETPDQGTQDAVDVVTPITVSLVSPGDVIPVRGSDGRYHVVYELLLTNASAAPATLDNLTILNAAGGAPVFTMSSKQMIEGHALRLVDRMPAESVSLPASATRVLLVAVSFAAKVDIPRALKNQLEITGLNPISLDPSRKASAFRYSASLVSLSSTQPPVLAPPLEGDGWVGSDGCCGPDSHHVNAVLPINGAFVAAERFASDWIQVDSAGFIVKGDPSKVSDWVGYGAKVKAAAGGVVIASRDGAPDQTPGIVPDLPLAKVPGNYVVIDQGGGFYGFYAHLKPGSVRVKAGEKVRAGEQIGQLGNSGGSAAPHLHFHVVRGPSAIASNGVPFVLDSFLFAGTADPNNMDHAMKGTGPLFKKTKNRSHTIGSCRSTTP